MATTYFTTPSGVTVRLNIHDRTGVAGMTAQAGAILRAAAEAAATVGLSRIDVTAAKGGGHKSHGAGTEWDIKGYTPEGTLWTPQQRVAVAEGGRTAGADRFGLYSFGKGYLGNGSLHVGYSGPGRPSSVWGYKGATSGDRSRAFSDQAEKQFLSHFNSGVIQELDAPKDPFGVDKIQVADIPTPRARPEQATQTAALDRGTLTVPDMNASTTTMMGKLNRGEPYTGQPTEPIVASDQWRDFQAKLRTGQVPWEQLPAEWQTALGEKLPNAREAYEKTRAAGPEGWVAAEAKQIAAAPFKGDPDAPKPLAFTGQPTQQPAAQAVEAMATRSVAPSTSTDSRARIARESGMPPQTREGAFLQQSTRDNNYAGDLEVQNPGWEEHKLLPESLYEPDTPTPFVSADKERAERPIAALSPTVTTAARPGPSVTAQLEELPPTPQARPGQPLYAPEIAEKIGSYEYPQQAPQSRQAIPAVPKALAARRAAPQLGGLIGAIFKALVPGARQIDKAFSGGSGAYASSATSPGAQWSSPNFNPISGGSKYPYFTNPTTGTGGYYDNQGDLHTYSLGNNAFGF